MRTYRNDSRIASVKPNLASRVGTVEILLKRWQEGIGPWFVADEDLFNYAADESVTEGFAQGLWQIPQSGLLLLTIFIFVGMR